jgi:hypothetical protein
MNHRVRWPTFRALLFLSGLTLVGYVVYRFALPQPPDYGSLYGRIFLLSLLLAVAGMVLGVSPRSLHDARGWPGSGIRVALSGFGAVWMATGLACTPSLVAGVSESPLRGTFDLIHMLSGHVYLPLAVAALAWAPARVARWLRAHQVVRHVPIGAPVLEMAEH